MDALNLQQFILKIYGSVNLENQDVLDNFGYFM